MKKYIIPIIIVILIIGLIVISLVFKKDDNNLTKIKVADTTLTSRTFMN